MKDNKMRLVWHEDNKKKKSPYHLRSEKNEIAKGHGLGEACIKILCKGWCTASVNGSRVNYPGSHAVTPGFLWMGQKDHKKVKYHALRSSCFAVVLSLSRSSQDWMTKLWRQQNNFEKGAPPSRDITYKNRCLVM